MQLLQLAAVPSSTRVDYVYLRAFAVLLLLPLAGCYQTPADRLQGVWIGKPDSAAAAAKRSEQVTKTQAATDKEDNENVPAANSNTGNARRSAEPTDLEAYDVAIQLEFHSDESVEMSLADGSEKRQGVWRVVAALPPSGAEIEISLDSDQQQKPGEKRRFLVEFENGADDSDATPGFTLREKGADVKFGRLYFSRVAK